MKTQSIKSKVMKSAWVIYRNTATTWSDALRLSWSISKNGIKMVVTKSYNGNIRAVYSKDGNTSDSVARLIELCGIVTCNKGAESYYNEGRYSGD
jgi:hypothetical protein